MRIIIVRIVRSRFLLVVAGIGIAVLFQASRASAQLYCDDPPVASVLTGDAVTVSALDSEGHPLAYDWYITPPDQSLPAEPTASGPTYLLDLPEPGLWSVGLDVHYQHQATGGGLWSSQACVTIEATSVVAAIELSATQVSTDETLELSGANSQWAATVVPGVEWQIDDVPFAACNGGPPPSSPLDLSCTVSAGWLAPGWHSAGLRLTDPSSGQSSLATDAFEVIEVVPLSVDFAWTPFHPDPGQLVHFVAQTTPSMPEENLSRVVWDMGDGTVITYTSCPLFYGSCLEWPHTFTTDGWYNVSLTVETADESANRGYEIEVGDPVSPPTAAFTVAPPSPQLLESAALTFAGSCEGTCSWSWDFGDGETSSLQSPTHAWAVPAIYTVSMIVTNDGGSDESQLEVPVNNCWVPSPPSQNGACYGGPVTLTAAAGSAWSWSTGATTQMVAVSAAGGYWVNVRSGSSCWGHASTTVVLANCGDPGGDVNLDGHVDGADPAALIPELTDGDGDTVVGAGGGDLTAPGGDVTRDGRLRIDDLAAVVAAIFQ